MRKTARGLENSDKTQGRANTEANSTADDDESDLSSGENEIGGSVHNAHAQSAQPEVARHWKNVLPSSPEDQNRRDMSETHVEEELSVPNQSSSEVSKVPAVVEPAQCNISPEQQHHHGSTGLEPCMPTLSLQEMPLCTTQVDPELRMPTLSPQLSQHRLSEHGSKVVTGQVKPTHSPPDTLIQNGQPEPGTCCDEADVNTGQVPNGMSEPRNPIKCCDVALLQIRKELSTFAKTFRQWKWRRQRDFDKVNKIRYYDPARLKEAQEQFIRTKLKWIDQKLERFQGFLKTAASRRLTEKEKGKLKDYIKKLQLQKDKDTQELNTIEKPPTQSKARDSNNNIIILSEPLLEDHKYAVSINQEKLSYSRDPVAKTDGENLSDPSFVVSTRQCDEFVATVYPRIPGKETEEEGPRQEVEEVGTAEEELKQEEEEAEIVEELEQEEEEADKAEEPEQEEEEVETAEEEQEQEEEEAEIAREEPEQEEEEVETADEGENIFSSEGKRRETDEPGKETDNSGDEIHVVEQITEAEKITKGTEETVGSLGQQDSPNKGTAKPAGNQNENKHREEDVNQIKDEASALIIDISHDETCETQEGTQTGEKGMVVSEAKSEDTEKEKEGIDLGETEPKEVKEESQTKEKEKQASSPDKKQKEPETETRNTPQRSPVKRKGDQEQYQAHEMKEGKENEGEQHQEKQKKKQQQPQQQQQQNRERKRHRKDDDESGGDCHEKRKRKEDAEVDSEEDVICLDETGDVPTGRARASCERLAQQQEIQETQRRLKDIRREQEELEERREEHLEEVQILCLQLAGDKGRLKRQIEDLDDDVEEMRKNGLFVQDELVQKLVEKKEAEMKLEALRTEQKELSERPKWFQKSTEESLEKLQTEKRELRRKLQSLEENTQLVTKLKVSVKQEKLK